MTTSWTRTVAMLAIAASILFHAWWPNHKIEQRIAAEAQVKYFLYSHCWQIKTWETLQDGKDNTDEEAQTIDFDCREWVVDIYSSGWYPTGWKRYLRVGDAPEEP